MQYRSWSVLGTIGVSKTDEFFEKFQSAFDPPPPPSFVENHFANVFQFHAHKALSKSPKTETFLNINSFGDATRPLSPS